KGFIMAAYSVLIVEDQKLLRNSLIRMVSNSGYAVYSAADGAEACGVLAVSAVDIVLSDLGMPRLDGFGLLRWLQEHGHSQPLIVISGHNAIESAIAALRLGAYDYITKPVTTDDVEAALRRAITKVAASRADAALRQRTSEIAALAAISMSAGNTLD